MPVETDVGHRFRGRTAALTEIVQWLDRGVPDRRVLVVTGSPGVGKSAVLGRVVTTADAEVSRHLPPDDDAVRARVGSVACAVHVKGKTANEVATEIARAASLAPPNTAQDLVPALRHRLTERRARFNLIADALDEAASPNEARLLLGAVLLPLAETCADLDAQVVVGTRRTDGDGDLLPLFGAHVTVIDLDDEAYFARSDLTEYTSATLRLVGAERPGNPYENSTVAEPVAERIAMLADRNFLVAGLVARMHGLYDSTPIDPSGVSFTASVDSALDKYISGLAPAGTTPARLVLTVLAYADAPGLPPSLWRAGVNALGCTVSEEQLAAFVRTSAANFLVETGTGPAARTYRLFHQALNEALLRHRGALVTHGDERLLADAWIRDGQTTGWSAAPDYLKRSLSAHAGRVDRIDDLLVDDAYLLHADLRRLMPVAERATGDAGRARARLLQLTPLAVEAPPAERAAMFSVTDALDRLGSRFVTPPDAPYTACWAHTPPRLERTVLEGHTDGVMGVCAVAGGQRSLLASASEDGTIRLWDPTTGQPERLLEGHTDRVRAVHAVTIGARTMLASASEDRTIRLWDPATGQGVRVLRGHTDWVRNVCTLPLGDRVHLASAGDDWMLRLWDPATGHQERVLIGHTGWITAVCTVQVADRTLLASAGYDGTVRLWDPATGHQERTLIGHTGWVTAVCTVQVADRTLLASAGYDGTVRLWDPITGQADQRAGGSSRPITGLCAVPLGKGQALAWTGEDGTVRVLHLAGPEPEQVLTGHTGWVTGVCAVPIGDRYLLASAGEDGTVRLWDPTTGQPDRVLDGGRIGPVAGVCAVPAAGRDLVASAGEDRTIRLWDPTTGDSIRAMTGHRAAVRAVCAIAVDERTLLASSGQDATVRLWDPATGEREHLLVGHGGWILGLCAIQVGERHLLASASDDYTIRLWNPVTGDIERTLVGHSEWVRGLCVVPVEGQHLLASASYDGTVRLWDAAGGALVRILAGHHAAVTGVCAVPVGEGSLLASASADRTIRLWDPGTGRPLSVLQGHTAAVTAVCTLLQGDRYLLVSTSEDRTVRLWDPVAGVACLSIPVHHRALSCWHVAGTLVIGLDSGVLAIALR